MTEVPGADRPAVRLTYARVAFGGRVKAHHAYPQVRAMTELADVESGVNDLERSHRMACLGRRFLPSGSAPGERRSAGGT